jgi:hypothetical protein
MLGKLFLPSLMFVGDARSSRKSGAPEREGSCLTRRYKNSGIFGPFVNLQI